MKLRPNNHIARHYAKHIQSYIILDSSFHCFWYPAILDIARLPGYIILKLTEYVSYFGALCTGIALL